MPSRSATPASSAVKGLAKRKPWTSPQPHSFSRSHCACDFHPFRDDVDIQLARETDGCPNDGGVIWRGFHIGDEVLGDLDLVDRKPAQIVERRIAGAKIIDSDRHAGLAEAHQKVVVLRLTLP